MESQTNSTEKREEFLSDKKIIEFVFLAILGGLITYFVLPLFNPARADVKIISHQFTYDVGTRMLSIKLEVVNEGKAAASACRLRYEEGNQNIPFDPLASDFGLTAGQSRSIVQTKVFSQGLPKGLMVNIACENARSKNVAVN